MAEIGTITPRLLYAEDFDLTEDPAGETANVPIMGVGTVPVTKLAMVLLTQYTEADSDALAASAGVQVGELYATSLGRLRCRLT